MNGFTRLFNFDNVGQKIKGLTKWSCWIMIFLTWIGSGIGLIVCLANDWMMGMAWIPFVVAGVVPFIIWIGSWTMYAFGEIAQGIIDMKNSATKTNPSDVVQRSAANPKLEKLNALRAKGLITEEEYAHAVSEGN
ncbi:MAG: SHOCT domain-containing protein [Clostridia bacterium]|nr:SHOCT domain-containing protein [Clostridia bacterium]